MTLLILNVVIVEILKNKKLENGIKIKMEITCKKKNNFYATKKNKQ
jgi:hypothetical protein